MSANHNSISQTPSPRTESSTTTEDDLKSSLCEFSSFEHVPEEDTYRALYDATDIPPSRAVVGAVSAVSNRGLEEMDPLFHTIDPDALDSLISRQAALDDGAEITFDFAGYVVTAGSQGAIEVQKSSTAGE